MIWNFLRNQKFLFSPSHQEFTSPFHLMKIFFFSSRAITSTSSPSHHIWKLRYTLLTLPIYVKKALPMIHQSHRSYDQFQQFLNIMHSSRTLWFWGTLLIRRKALNIQLCSHLGGRGFPSKCELMRIRGRKRCISANVHT